MMMTMMILTCFLNPKGFQTQSEPGGWGINYDDNDDDDDDIENDDDDDDEVLLIAAKFCQV